MIIQNVYQDAGFLIKVSIPNTIDYSVKNINDSENSNQKAIINNRVAMNQSIGDSYQQVTIINNDTIPRIRIFK